MIKILKALEDAQHELTLVSGMTAFDSATEESRKETILLNYAKSLKLLDDAISEFYEIGKHLSRFD